MAIYFLPLSSTQNGVRIVSGRMEELGFSISLFQFVISFKYIFISEALRSIQMLLGNYDIFALVSVPSPRQIICRRCRYVQYNINSYIYKIARMLSTTVLRITIGRLREENRWQKWRNMFKL